MQETSASELHPFGDLPVDIARIIFEIAALLSRPTAVQLCLVSKTVSRWIEPALYRTVVLFCERDIMAFARAMKYRNDPPFFASNVKTLCFGDMLNGNALLTDLRKTPDSMSLICSTCTGIERLGYGVTVSTYSHLSPIEAAVFADCGTKFPHLTHLSMLEFDARSLRANLPPQITHLHLDCYDEGRTVIQIDWGALFSRCTRLTHLFLSGHALNYSLALCNTDGPGTQWLGGFDLLELLRPAISCLPATLTALVISVVPEAYLVTMLPQARSLVKQLLDSDERILMISPRSVYRGLIDGLYCCEGNNVFNYAPQWEDNREGDDMWEFAERCIASRKRARGGV
ncbi:hypothetical protein BDZ89DRAFT_1066850 [Hymenopellis radicata]|nr:hypothetical protein BDZ89DRAFT_1066850 [Hymenopellis radicata]